MAKVAVRHDSVSSNASAARLRTKKRARDVSKTVVVGLLGILVAQAVAALYFSPVFAVRPDTLAVRATPLCSESDVRSLINADLPRSVMQLPTQRWVDALETIPAVKSATITTRFPNRVNVSIMERQACLQANLGELGSCVLDQDLIPFRVVEAKDASLPIVDFQSIETSPSLGASLIDKTQVDAVQTILKWISRHADISITSIKIQNKHLAFTIKASNVNVMLGTSRRLTEKLDSLEVIIKKRPDLLTSHKYAAVNLFSDEYPALVLRSTSSDKLAVP